MGTDLKPQGLDVEMANYIGAKLGVKVELIPVTSANRIPYLQTQKADLVISTLGKNPEREKVIDFTAAYTPFFQAVLRVKTKFPGWLLSVKPLAAFWKAMQLVMTWLAGPLSAASPPPSLKPFPSPWKSENPQLVDVST